VDEPESSFTNKWCIIFNDSLDEKAEDDHSRRMLNSSLLSSSLHAAGAWQQQTNRENQAKLRRKTINTLSKHH
jgi:hypothetical protein